MPYYLSTSRQLIVAPSIITLAAPATTTAVPPAGGGLPVFASRVKARDMPAADSKMTHTILDGRRFLKHYHTRDMSERRALGCIIRHSSFSLRHGFQIRRSTQHVTACQLDE